jgi:hypothetical protein
LSTDDVRRARPAFARLVVLDPSTSPEAVDALEPKLTEASETRKPA